MANDEEPKNNLLSVLGEWGDLFQSIPGAAKAVAKLVGKGADTAGAWIDIAQAEGESRANEIRATTNARNEVRNAMVKAAIDSVADDPDLGRRALSHFASQLVEHQNNREEVVKMSLGDLRGRPPVAQPDSEPSDDWLNFFSIYAEKASSLKLRQHWALILAGEIRKPGSVSLLTMKMMSVVDENFARIIDKFAKYIVRDEASKVIPLLGDFVNPPMYDELVALDSLGFLSIANHAINGVEFPIGDYILRMPAESQIQISCAILSLAGVELTEIISPATSDTDAVFVREQVASMYPIIVLLDREGNQIAPAH